MLFPDLRRLLSTLRHPFVARRAGDCQQHGEDDSRLSLLSVVRRDGESRLMGVEEIDGDSVVCAWVQDGMRRTARYPRHQLHVVPALLDGPEEYRWREALRAASHRKFG